MPRCRFLAYRRIRCRSRRNIDDQFSKLIRIARASGLFHASILAWQLRHRINRYNQTEALPQVAELGREDIWAYRRRGRTTPPTMDATPAKPRAVYTRTTPSTRSARTTA